MNRLQQIQALVEDQDRFFRKLVRLCAECELEADEKANRLKQFTREDNVIYPECFQKRTTGQKIS